MALKGGHGATPPDKLLPSYGPHPISALSVMYDHAIMRSCYSGCRQLLALMTVLIDGFSPILMVSVTSVAASHTLTVRQRCEDGCPGVRINTPGLLQQSHVWYC